MNELGKTVERAVKSEIKVQLGLVYMDIKEIKEENRNIKQKYFVALKKIRALEQAVLVFRQKEDGTDFGM